MFSYINTYYKYLSLIRLQQSLILEQYLILKPLKYKLVQKRKLLELIWSHTDGLYIKEDLHTAGCMLLLQPEKYSSKALVRGEESKKKLKIWSLINICLMRDLPKTAEAVVVT